VVEVERGSLARLSRPHWRAPARRFASDAELLAAKSWGAAALARVAVELGAKLASARARPQAATSPKDIISAVHPPRTNSSYLARLARRIFSPVDDCTDVGERSRVIGETLLGRYTVEALLGEGGMGLVYRAVDPSGRPVAIKRLHAAVASSPELAARFEREATAHSMLAHPNIVGLEAVGLSDDGAMFFVLEFVEGHDLATELEHGGLETKRAIQIACQVLSGLHHAHNHGLVHRDLKPENVLLAETPSGGVEVKLIDFGLVKMLNDVLGDAEVQRLTRTGVVFGTPQYMSPEQMMAETLDARSDLYAVGIVLFEMITGHRPFEAEEVTELWQAHLSAPVPSLADFDPALADPELDAILHTLLAKRVDERFANAAAARRALESCLEN